MATFLTGNLVCGPQFKKSEPVVVRFDLTNTGTAGVYVLTWYTPLEGECSDCVVVRRDGSAVRYKGPLAKRGYPEPEDYVFVLPGQTRSVNFNLSEIYPTDQPGKYSAELSLPVTYTRSLDDEVETVKLSCEPVYFSVW